MPGSRPDALGLPEGRSGKAECRASGALPGDDRRRVQTLRSPSGEPTLGPRYDDLIKTLAICANRTPGEVRVFNRSIHGLVESEAKKSERGDQAVQPTIIWR